MTTYRRNAYAYLFLISTMVLGVSLSAYSHDEFTEEELLDYGVHQAGRVCDYKLVTPPQIVLGTDHLDSVIGLKKEVKDVLKEKGPFGSTLGLAWNESNYRKGPLFFGIETAVRQAHALAAAFKPLIAITGGHIHPIKKEFPNEGVVIKTGVALGGSSVRSATFNDVDMEMSVIAKSDNFKIADFTNPNSDTIKASAQFFQEHAKFLTENKFIFSEFKAGEYDQALPAGLYEGEKGKGIKWSYQELQSGKKVILDRNGAEHVVTLTEAISQEARIKIDLLLPVASYDYYRGQDGYTKIRQHVFEITIVYFLGGQRKENTPTLKLGQVEHFPQIGASGGHVVERGRSSVLPLRSTVLFYYPEELKLARDLSLSAPGPDGYLLNIMSIAHIQEMLKEKDSFKAIKRMRGRLKYWDDSKGFLLEYNRKNNEAETGDSFNLKLKEITEYKPFQFSERIRLDFENRSKSARLMTPEDFSGLQKILKEKLPEVKLMTNWAEQAIEIKKWTDSEARRLIAKEKVVSEYVNWIRSASYVDKMVAREKAKVFISFELPKSWQKTVDHQLSIWRKKYPHIPFVVPDDLHMTVSYLGEFPKAEEAEVKRLMAEFENEIGGINLGTGHLKLMGAEGKLIAIQFDPNDLTVEQKNKMFEFKRKLERLGLKPDRFIEEFLPHVSIANIGDTMMHPVGSNEVNHFFAEEEVSESINDLTLSGRVILIQTLSEIDRNDSGQQYREFELDSEF